MKTITTTEELEAAHNIQNAVVIDTEEQVWQEAGKLNGEKCWGNMHSLKTSEELLEFSSTLTLIYPFLWERL